MNCDQITEQHVLDWLFKAGLGPNELGKEELKAAAEDILGHKSSPTAELRIEYHANRITKKALAQYGAKE